MTNLRLLFQSLNINTRLSHFKNRYFLRIHKRDLQHVSSLNIPTRKLNFFCYFDRANPSIFVSRIAKVADTEKEEMTYCFTEPILGCGVFNGILTKQSETYSLLIDTYIKDYTEKNMLFNAIETIPSVKKKADWAFNYIEKGSFVESLVAFCVVESLFFSSSFAAIFYIKTQKLLPGLCQANEFISRDEGLHARFAIHYYNNYVSKKDKLSIDALKKIILEAVDIEKEFVTDSLPVSLIGLNSGVMCQYVEFVADGLLLDLIGESHFNVSNPLSFMESISVKRKNNFFEKRVTEYQEPTNINGVIDLSDDF